jgi:hypothetical protein
MRRRRKLSTKIEGEDGDICRRNIFSYFCQQFKEEPKRIDLSASSKRKGEDKDGFGGKRRGFSTVPPSSLFGCFFFFLFSLAGNCLWLTL